MDANVLTFNLGTSTGTLALPVGFLTKAAIWFGNGLGGTTNVTSGNTADGIRHMGFTAGRGARMRNAESIQAR